MPLRQMNVLIPEDELERLKKTADAKGISVAEYVRRAIALQFAYELWLERQQPPERRTEDA
jgi:predicted DNA binding CopG/RHH family protein